MMDIFEIAKNSVHQPLAGDVVNEMLGEIGSGREKQKRTLYPRAGGIQRYDKYRLGQPQHPYHDYTHPIGKNIEGTLESKLTHKE